MEFRNRAMNRREIKREYEKGSDCSSLPDRYYIEKSGATYNIYDSKTDEVVSFGYHRIKFPDAKIGASSVTLTKHNGYFVPQSFRPHKKDKQIYPCVFEAYTDYKKSHGIARINNKKDISTKYLGFKDFREDINSNKNNFYEIIYNIYEKFKLFGDTENSDCSQDQNLDENGIENDNSKSIEASESTYVNILFARLSGVLEEKSKDWYILLSYKNVDRNILKNIKTIEDIDNFDHPYNLDRYMNELNEADKISRNEESVDPIVEMFA